MADQMAPFGTNEEKALNFIVQYLKEGRSKASPYRRYDHDLFISDVMHEYVKSEANIQNDDDRRKYFPGISPYFYTVAWDLCRQGILRPGVINSQHIVPFDGNGYSLTPSGKDWLNRGAGSLFLPVIGLMGKLLAPFEHQFSSTFMERSQDAILCYNAGAYLDLVRM